MASEVTIALFWTGGERQDVKAAAEAAIDKIVQNEEHTYSGSPYRDAATILNAIAEGKGCICGPKGEGWAISYVGNYSQPEEILKVLLPFFKRLWPYKYRFGPVNEGGEKTKTIVLGFHNFIMVAQSEHADKVSIWKVKYPGEIEKIESDIPLSWWN